VRPYVKNKAKRKATATVQVVEYLPTKTARPSTAKINNRQQAEPDVMVISPIPVISVLGRLKQDGLQFKTSLGNVVRQCLINKKRHPGEAL
jgi:hypothetical protein